MYLHELSLVDYTIEAINALKEYQRLNNSNNNWVDCIHILSFSSKCLHA